MDPNVLWVIFVGDVRSAAYILYWDPFGFGIVFAGRYTLNVTLMSGQVNVGLTNGAHPPSALVLVGFS